MTDAAATLGPVRLRQVADGLKREALWLSSERGGPLTEARNRVLKALQGPLGEGIGFLLGTWEREQAELGNDLRRLASRLEAVLDELAYIAQIEANGFPPPTAKEDLAPALSAWAARPERHSAFSPTNLQTSGPQASLRQIDTDLTRELASQLDGVAGEVDGRRRRLEELIRPLGLDGPRELFSLPEDLRALAADLRRRVDTLTAADTESAPAAASLAAAFGGLLGGKAVAAALTPVDAGTRNRPSPAKQAGADARRIMKELKPSGIFDLADFDRGRELLDKAERASTKDPRYAVAFLAALGPKNLRWLIEKGRLDPCTLGSVVALASLGGADRTILKEAIGADRFDAPRRAALLAGCECPRAYFHPGWSEHLVEVLYLGRNTAQSRAGDSRRWYRRTADKLIDQLAQHPPQLAKPGEDALERLILFARKHPLDPPGKLALARLLARPETMQNVAEQLAGGITGEPPGAEGFNVDRDELRPVIAALVSDREAGPLLTEAATRFTTERLAVAAPAFSTNREDRRADLAMAEVGALFGALASRSYDTQAALDVAEVSADAVKGILDALAGAALEAVDLNPAVSLAVESGKAIVFALGSGEAARRRAEAELRQAAAGQARREKLVSRLEGDLHHLAFVGLLADARTRAALALKLCPEDLPEDLPRDLSGRVDGRLRNAGIESVAEWRDVLFDKGRLRVPDPNSDPRSWKAFLAWTDHVNPDLATAADQLNGTMHEAFQDQVLRSQ